MELVKPEIGLIFWTSLSFLILLFILGKFAWKPILGALTERELFIEDSLNKAEAAKEEMESLVKKNDDLLKQARAERDLILQEAKKIKDQMIADAKLTAAKEGARMIEQAKLEINNQKAIAMADIKNQVSTLSLDIAEKVLRKQFEDHKKQEELVGELLKEVTLN